MRAFQQLDSQGRHVFARLFNLNRYLQNPGLLARRINRALAGKGFIERAIADRFATAGASAGESWPKLAVSTQKQRRRQGFGASAPILVRGGALLRAAIGGKAKATAEVIEYEMGDGPADTYLGGGKVRPARVRNVRARKAEEAAARAGTRAAGGWTRTGRVSDFARALNFGTARIPARPFLGPLSAAELAPLLAERDRLIELVVAELIGEGKVTSV